jgi:hypothetical protein
MSIKVNLEFVTKFDLNLLSKGKKVRLIRLIGDAHLLGEKNWLPLEKVIIDTGNPISIIPFSIWSLAKVSMINNSANKIYGLNDNEATAIQAKLGWITIVMKDEFAASKPIEIKAYLLNADTAPFIIGYEDLLTNAVLHSDYKRNIAYLEFE